MKSVTTSTAGHSGLVSRQPAQAKCLFCNEWLLSDERSCLSDDEKMKLANYAIKNGRRWKSILATEWANGSEELRETRNRIGPSGIRKIKTPDLLRWEEVATRNKSRENLKRVQQYRARVGKGSNEQS